MARAEKLRNDGVEFEYYSMEYHRQRYNDIVYHSSVIPEQDLFAANIFHEYNSRRLMRNAHFREQKAIGGIGTPYVDNGIDFLIKRPSPSLTENEKDAFLYHVGQSKNYSRNRVTQNDLGGFFRNMRMTRTPGYLYTTTPLEIGIREDLMKDPEWFTHTILPFTPSTATATAQPTVIAENALTLRDYQQVGIQTMYDYFSENADTGRALLHVGCGLGKTLMAGHLFQRIKRPQTSRVYICIAPLRVSVANLADRLMPFFNGGASSSSTPLYAKLLVDSDAGGFTDPGYIGSVIAQNKPLVIFSTYDSFFNLLMPEFGEWFADNDPFLLVDEMHNLTAAECDVVNQFQTSLLMSATIPETLKKRLNATVVYKYGMAEGIGAGYLCDYEVVLPLLKKVDVVVVNDGEAADNEATYDEATDDEATDDEAATNTATDEIIVTDEKYEVDITIPNECPKTDMSAKALFLAKGMLEKGARRCIVYLRNTVECDEFLKVFKTSVCADYHGLRVWGAKLDYTASAATRQTILREFQADSREHDLFVIASVRILDEAVDIPRCDSEFITYVGDQTSDIRTVQRLQRGGRLDRRNPNKKNHMFMWCDDLNKAINALLLMRREDPVFHKKLRILSADYVGSDQKNARAKEKKETTDIQIKVETIGCETLEERWQRRFAEGKLYTEQHNKLAPRGTPLGTWFDVQKRNINTMPAERRDQLLTLPPFREWYESDKKPRIQKEWLVWFSEGKLYTEQHNKLAPWGTPLGSWFNKQKEAIDTMSAERRDQLLTLPPFREWYESDRKPRIKKEWSVWFSEGKLYTEQHNKLAPSGTPLGTWFHTQKTAINTMSPERREQLMTLPPFRNWYESRAP